MPQDFARPDSQIFRAYYVQQRRKKRKGGGIPINPGPVSDYLLNYRLDNNDVNVVPIMSPVLVASPEFPDELGWDLNGVDQYGTASTDSSLFALGTGAYSITGWINSANLALKNIISTGDGTLDGSITIRTTASGLLQIRSFNQNKTSAAVIVDGKNNFFCISCDGSGLPVRIYINGVLDSTQTASPYNLTDQGIVVIGARGDNVSGKWDGILDGIRLYNRAITGPENVELYEYSVYVDPVPNWIVRYTMDDNDTNLVPIMSPAIVTGVDLPDEKATEFNGVDQYFIANADSATIATIGSGPFTIVFRIRTSQEAARKIVDFGDKSTTSGFRITTRLVGGVTFSTNNLNLNLGYGGLLSGEWAHVVITGTGSEGTLEFFIDGVSEQTRTLPVYNFIDTNEFEIAESGLLAALDEFRFYTSVLPQVDITALSNNKDLP